VAEAIAAELKTRLSWDEDAGEDWARALVKDEAGVMICMAGPLVVASAHVGAQIAVITSDVPVITAPTFDALVLSCDVQTLQAAFPNEDWGNLPLNPERFSADELWFCTI
jgi:hypothetical protein